MTKKTVVTIDGKELDTENGKTGYVLIEVEVDVERSVGKARVVYDASLVMIDLAIAQLKREREDRVNEMPSGFREALGNIDFVNTDDDTSEVLITTIHGDIVQ